MTTMAMTMKLMKMYFHDQLQPKYGRTSELLNTVRRSVICILINVLLKVPDMVNRMTGVDVTNVRTIHEKYL